eukprot:TRINITY_DN15_c0_g1_i10.p2 TRINITY_DN15_c0_g1~~TRINITY_DN15_c0_g1_i10.p2  ORF type:complete len:335 (-),score=69.71 TRINITY_DN15_c0_g1_i10:73-1077(-)
MGGQSTGTFTQKDGTGIFDGQVVDVPFLKAPGFIKAEGSGSFPDVSSCANLVITARAAAAYDGYRASFGNAKPPGGKYFASGYKAHFNAPVGAEFTDVVIPFTNFSDLWNDATGDLIKTCQDDKVYCPDKTTLQDMKTLSVWGEGKGGAVHLEIKQIRASGCSPALVAAAAPIFNSTCKGPIQDNLRYNISNTDASKDWSLPVPPGESLASAVCCDPFYAAYAEPQHMFDRPDVALFAHFEENKTVTFYDSVCGLPVFVAPRGRTLEDFKADTTEHGWPSFRPEELVVGNSRIVNSTGEVVSACGTHLGSFLPDNKGARWCLDLSCVSGNAIKF